MRLEWENLSVHQIQQLYLDASQKLEEMLLNGASWKDTHEKRRDVTELSMLLYKKLEPSIGNPAEHSSRRNVKKL